MRRSVSLRHTVGNVYAVARREYTWRASTRTFIVTTIVLLVAAVGLAMAPTIISYFDRNESQTVAVYASGADPHGDPVATLDALLNAQARIGSGSAGTSEAGTNATAGKDFSISTVPSEEDGRAAVLDGKLSALLVISRSGSGDLQFTLYTNDRPFGRTPQLIQQASTAIAIGDRLAQAGLDPAQQGRLFVPPDYSIQNPDPSKPQSSQSGLTQDITNTLVGSALAIFIFMAIVLYGTWVAMSVVEEKSSRVMEIILGAATPVELLGGKVLGVGAVALTQYVVIIVPAIIALLFQGQIAAVILGGSAGSVALPAGLTVSTLVAFTIFLVLGFGMYAVLFAAAGSLVSRQEDVNQIIAPMMLVSTAGYLVSVWAATGFFDLDAPWVVALSYVPFLSPYLMPTRLMAGKAAPWEAVIAMLLVVIAIAFCVWIAARIYAAGVLMYGQKPGLRLMARAMRSGR